MRRLKAPSNTNYALDFVSKFKSQRGKLSPFFTIADGEAAFAFVQTAPLPSPLLLQGTAQMNAVTKSRAARTDITKLLYMNIDIVPKT